MKALEFSFFMKLGVYLLALEPLTVWPITLINLFEAWLLLQQIQQLQLFGPGQDSNADHILILVYVFYQILLVWVARQQGYPFNLYSFVDHAIGVNSIYFIL